MKTKYIIIVVLLILIFFTLKYCMVSPIPEPIKPSSIAKVEVNCQTESLADKVKGNPEAKEFVLSEGECEVQSPIVITQDNVIFRGQGKTKTFVKPTKNFVNTMPVFKIVGARGVTLTGFTVQNGKQGVLIIDSQVVIYNVVVKDNLDTNLCIIGLDEKDKVDSKKQDSKILYEKTKECPRSQVVTTSIVEQIKSTNKIRSVNSKLLTSAESNVASTLPNCLPNDLPEACDTNDGGGLECRDTNVNICCSNFNNSHSIGIIAINSTVLSSHTNPNVRCASNINNNANHGLLLMPSSSLYTFNARLNLNNNGQNPSPDEAIPGIGLFGVATNTVTLGVGSQIESNTNKGFADILIIENATVNCNDSSSINVPSSRLFIMGSSTC